MLTNTETRRLQYLLNAGAAALRDSIRSDLLASEEQRYVELAGSVHHAGNEAVADMLTDIDNVFAVRHANALREVDAALFRISQGNYGTCPDCGGQIPLGRLRENPAARRCFACQQVRAHPFGRSGQASL